MRDNQAGLLAAFLFLGSFFGTILLAKQVERSTRLGSLAAFLGLLLFGFSSSMQSGFRAGAAGIAVAGFGLGQLMSSINLLAGREPSQGRSALLARLGAAWCVGALLSPLLTTVMITSFPASLRVTGLSLVFLLPLLGHRQRLTMTSAENAGVPGFANDRFRVVVLCTLAFLLYGGVEACIGGWLPLYAVRYGATGLRSAQLITSSFWLGLILSRSLLGRMLLFARPSTTLKCSLSGVTLFMLWLLFAPPSHVWLVIAAAVAGVCLGPGFPLMLTLALSWKLSARGMGVVLAACGLGATALLSIMGVVASAWSLRIAMMVPFAGLVCLLLLQWQPPADRFPTSISTKNLASNSAELMG